MANGNQTIRRKLKVARIEMRLKKKQGVKEGQYVECNLEAREFNPNKIGGAADEKWRGDILGYRGKETTVQGTTGMRRAVTRHARGGIRDIYPKCQSAGPNFQLDYPRCCSKAGRVEYELR